MIKVIAGANRHPGSRPLEEFHRYWGEKHGPLFAKTPELRRYVQHHTLPEAYGTDLAPTHDGASMFWYDDLEVLRKPPESPKLSAAIREEDGPLFDWYVRSARYGDPDSVTLRETVRADDQQLFDRADGWPAHTRRISVAAVERIVVDGPTSPGMVKSLTAAARMPGLSLDEFHRHWFEVHGPLCARVPGLRRYVQNHVLPEAYAVRGPTHDGWAELWFDDLDALHRARSSPEWRSLADDGRTVFAQPMATVIARERIIKDWQ